MAGTAAVTTQGMGEAEMVWVAALLASVLRGETETQKAREEVRSWPVDFCRIPAETG